MRASRISAKVGLASGWMAVHWLTRSASERITPRELGGTSSPTFTGGSRMSKGFDSTIACIVQERHAGLEGLHTQAAAQRALTIYSATCRAAQWVGSFVIDAA